MGNPQKSWRGAPTTNFFTNGHFSNGTGITQESGSNPTNTVISFPNNPGETEYVLEQSMGSATTEYQINLTTELIAGTTYVMSGWYAESADYSSADGSRMFHSRAFSSSGAHIATGNGIGTVIETRVINGITWRYCYATITTPADYSNSFNWYVGYGGSSYTGRRYYTNIQMEQGTYPSRFVNGTRSNTQAILDLTNNNTINATALTYNNDGTFEFDGINDSMSFGGASRFFTSYTTQQITIETWIYVPSSAVWTNGFYGNIVTRGYFGGSHGIFRTPTNNFVSAWFRQQGVFVGGGQVESTGIIQRDQWQQIVAIWKNPGSALYINGTLVSQNSTALASPNAVPTDDLWYAGFNTAAAGGSGNFFEGKQSGIKIYNRALTSDEVQQNFQALRGRFGL
jgi:hypothetical protein